MRLTQELHALAWPAERSYFPEVSNGHKPRTLLDSIICFDGSPTLIPSMFVGGAHILLHLTRPHIFMSAGLASIGWSFRLYTAFVSTIIVSDLSRRPRALFHARLCARRDCIMFASSKRDSPPRLAASGPLWPLGTTVEER
jgi:hypothetical protein